MKKNTIKPAKSMTQALPPEVLPGWTHRILWWSCLYLALSVGSTMTLLLIWQEASLTTGLLLVYGLLSAVCSWLLHFQKRSPRRKRILGILPWAAVLLLCFLGNPVAGAASWLNSFLLRWNEGHETLLRTLNTAATSMDENAFAALLITATSQCTGGLLYRKHTWLGLGYILGMLVLSLLGAPSAALPVALLVLGLLGYFLSGPTVDTSGRGALIWGISAAILFLGTLLPGTTLAGITNFRSDLHQQVRLLRYGEEMLPLGDLTRAETLQSNGRTAISVRSAQEKNLYLKAFTGSVYDSGRWEDLSDAAFGGENTGMLTWLKKQGFTPQTQLAQYLSLCESRVAENTLEIIVNADSRERIYAPSSLNQISKRTVSYQQDQDILAKGLFGKRNYQYTELSGLRPGELSVLERWVADPTTPEQAQYAQAEAVYREFVYENYTQVDENLEPLMQGLFHSEELESDSVFTVLTHVREILRARCSRSQQVEDPGDQDPIAYFLTKSYRGNAMLFASAAVEALRSYDIPARYAEGYYCASSKITSARGDLVNLTGQSAHAWVEVYFDGMGWIPVDVTPGYYYDMVALQQLVGLPDDVTKTADVTKNDQQAGDLPGDGDGGQAEPRQETPQRARLEWLLPTVVTVLLILALTVLAAEITRFGAMRILKYRYRHSDSLSRARMMEKLLFRVLESWGVPASLGWNTAGTDALLPQVFPQVEAGEYTRVCQLLEKAVYGEIPPEIYEERTIVSLLRKLSTCRPGTGLRYQFQSRYRWIDLV